MNADQILIFIPALNAAVLAIISWNHARSTNRMFKEMKHQAKIQVITSEISVFNNGQASKSGSVSTEQVINLMEEQHFLTEET